MRMIRLALSSLAASLTFLLGLGCAVAALTGQLGRFNPHMDVASHFAPFWLTGAVAVTLYALFLAPRSLRVAFATLGLVGVAAAGGLMAPEYLRPMSPRAPADAPNRLKLIQFNGWKDNTDVEASARWLAGQGADVIVMEEARPPLVERVAELTGYHVSCAKCGVVIYTRAEPLKAPKLKAQGPPDWRVRPPIAEARFLMAGREVVVVGTHTVWPTQAGWQRSQGQFVARTLAELPRDRLILAGDFNSTPWSFGRRAEDKLFGLERRTQALFSWPARDVLDGKRTLPFPFLPIDHVYAGPDWRTVKVRRGPRLGSDHYPVVVTLALKP